jgi:lysophospholipase L1-like esterase
MKVPFYGLPIAAALFFTTLLRSTSLAGTEQMEMTAIGDSLTSGFDSEFLGDNRSLSWSTGSSAQVFSHAQRLRRAGKHVNTHNLSVPGTKITSLAPQISLMLLGSPDYVTLTLGANDLCAMDAQNSEDHQNRFATMLRHELYRIIQRKPSVKILIMPIPNMYNLWEVAIDHGSCQSRWDLTDFCPVLLDSARTPTERQEFVERWRSMNGILAHLAAAFPDNVLFDPTVAESVFTMDDLSELDCFHPSIAGQNLIAEKTWSIVPTDF